MSNSFDPRSSRRGFLQYSAAGGAIAFYCTIGGQQVALEKPGDAAKADAAAARVRRPRAVAKPTEPVDALTFGRPEPAPGGRYVEYWIEARTITWNIVPTARDDWHDVAIPGKTTFKAVCYQQMTNGFAAPVGPPGIPGPILEAEVGDVLLVHFRNGLIKLDQAVTMHPHGVRYTPDYDGVYLGQHTRVGGFIAPGEEFTYRWEARPDSVGVWPYHDHGPNHTLNTMRGMFGGIVIRPKGAPRPDVENYLFFHSFSPSVTGLPRPFQCINGRAYAGNTPTLRAKVGDTVRTHIIGMDDNFHDFHVHGHRWPGRDGKPADVVSLGPNETVTAEWTEDNAGRWLYHCHVFSHQDGGMVGYLLVEP